MDMNDINGRIRELVKVGQEDKVYELLRLELTQYFSTPDGRAEIDRSPNKHLKTEEAVSMLLQHVPTRLSRVIKEERSGT